MSIIQIEITKGWTEYVFLWMYMCMYVCAYCKKTNIAVILAVWHAQLSKVIFTVKCKHLELTLNFFSYYCCCCCSCCYFFYFYFFISSVFFCLSFMPYPYSMNNCMSLCMCVYVHEYICMSFCNFAIFYSWIYDGNCLLYFSYLVCATTTSTTAFTAIMTTEKCFFLFIFCC